jgi:hypothetical protein
MVEIWMVNDKVFIGVQAYDEVDDRFSVGKVESNVWESRKYLQLERRAPPMRYGT